METIELYKIEVDVDAAQKAVIDYQIELEKLKKQKKEIEDANKKGELSEEDYAKAIVATNNAIKKASQAQKDATKQLKLADKAANTNKNSYQSLTLQYSEAKKKLNELEDAFKVSEDGSIELTEAYIAQAEEVKKLKDAVIAFDKGVSSGATNVGNYTDSFKQAVSETKVFGVSLGSLNEGFGKLTQGGIKGAATGILDLGKSIIATPIGALIVGFTALSTLFSRNQKAVEFLRKASSQFGEVLDFLLKPVDLLIDGLVFLGEKAISVGTAITDFFGISDSETTKSAYELEEALIDIEKAQSDIEARNKQAIFLEEKLKTLRDDESKGLEARIKANEELAQVEQKRIAELLEQENKRLEVLKQQFENEENSVDKEELRVKINEQNLKIAELNEESEGRRVEQITNQNGLLKEQRELRLSINQTQLELDVLQGKILKGSQAELEARKQLVKDRLKSDLENQQGAEERKQKELEATLEIATLEKDFADQQKERIAESIEKQKEAAEKAKERAKEQAELNRKIAENEITSYQAVLQKRLDDFDAFTETINEKDQVAILKRGEERLKLEREILDEQILLRKFQEEGELLALEEQAKELRAKGVKTAEFVASEQRRIKLSTLEELNKLELDFQLKNAETTKNILKTTLQLDREERIKALENELLDLQNAAAEKRLNSENDFALQREIDAKNFELKIEALRAQLDTEEITYEEYLDRNLSASIEYKQKEVDAKIAEEQRLAEADRRLKQAQIDTLQAFSDIGIAIAGENEEAQKGLLLFQKSLALAQVALNLSQEISNQNLAGSKLDAGLPGSGVVYRILAVARAVASAAKIVADIKKISGFAEGGYTGSGFGQPDSSGYKVAGFVHENEYVIPERILNTQQGSAMASSLESMRLRGYAQGGFVASNAGGLDIESLSGVVISAIANLPAPVVSVKEITNVASRVQSTETIVTF